jgi:hypothetical protein
VLLTGVDPKHPVITGEIVQWSMEIARRSCRMLIDQLETRVADNDKQAEYRRIRAIIAEAGIAGIARGQIIKAVKGSTDTRRIDDIITQLAFRTFHVPVANQEAIQKIVKGNIAARVACTRTKANSISA